MTKNLKKTHEFSFNSIDEWRNKFLSEEMIRSLESDSVDGACDDLTSIIAKKIQPIAPAKRANRGARN